jgi:hypothetical protein
VEDNTIKKNQMRWPCDHIWQTWGI